MACEEIGTAALALFPVGPAGAEASELDAKGAALLFALLLLVLFSFAAAIYAGVGSGMYFHVNFVYFLGC